MKPFTLFLVGTLLAPALSVAAAEAETPIIEFHTTLYEQHDVSNAFHFTLGTKKTDYYDIDFGFGTAETEIQPAVYDPESQSIKGTVITGSVSEAGIVRIYGDPANIDYVDFEGCYITDIKFPQLTELEILNLEHNELTGLDLSDMHKLQSISVSDNPFSPTTPLVIGKDKPDLAILSMGQSTWLDPSFSLRDYPSLVSFDAWGNKGLTTCDPTGCPELMRLTIDATPVSSLDVTKNPKLIILNIGDTHIPSIDLSANKNLREFYCSNGGSIYNDVKFKELNLGEKPDLVYFFCSYNDLTELDVTGCPNLISFHCQGNYLTSLDISKNPYLYDVNISNNWLNFVTIPADRETFGEYYYFQRNFPVDRSYKVGSEIDFSSKVNRPESTTTATLYMVDETRLEDPILLGEEYYTFKDGKITMLKETSDSVYISFSNSALPAFALKTDKFMVKSAESFGTPNRTAMITFSSAATEVAMNVGMSGASAAAPVSFSVDFGDGVLKEFTTTTYAVDGPANVSGTPVGRREVIIYAPEGHDLTALAIRDTPILRTDFSDARSLSILEITGCQLPRIDLKWNRCLATLNLSSNTLASLDMTTDLGGYDKNVLTDINVSDNWLEEIAISSHRAALHINASHNKLTEFPTAHMARLLTLDVSDNLLTELSLQDCEALTTLDASSNRLTGFYVPDYTPLTSLNIALNDITIPELPAVGVVDDYTYAPQRKVNIPTKAPSVNLSAEWLVKDGESTVYTWHKESDDSVLTDAQVSGNEGRFTFTDLSVGNVYCAVTHPAFPAFAGADAIMTTVVEAAAAPTNLFAKMTTQLSDSATIILAAHERGTTVYADWSGNGDLDQYVLNTDYQVFPVITSAGTEVKFYSYEEKDGVSVFSYTGGTLKNVDLSAMKQLTFLGLYHTALTPEDIRLPESESLTGLQLAGNNFSSLDAINYPRLQLLGLDYNNFTTLDLSKFTNLRNAYAAHNNLEEVRLDNRYLWDLSLLSNKLTSLDLSKVPAMNQLWLSSNNLSTLDVSGLDNLQVLYIDQNDFTFATLPPVLPTYNIYNFLGQNLISVEVNDGKVDLSSQVAVDGTPTVYHWFIDSPYLDEVGELAGEELVAGEEYTIENGVTTFLGNFSHIMCVMTNERFPNLYLMTKFIDVKASALEEVIAGGDENAPVEYYDLRGVRVDNPTPGIYIRRQGSTVSKVVVK